MDWKPVDSVAKRSAEIFAPGAKCPHAEARLKRTSGTWIAYLALTYFALVLNCLGPVTSFIRIEQRLTYSQAGMLGSSFACGFVAASLLAAGISRKLGSWHTLTLACVGLISGSALICVAKNFAVVLTGAFLAGTLGSLIISEVPLVLVREQQHRSVIALTEANALASATAIFGPAAVSLAEWSNFGWRAALLAPFALAIAAAAIFRFARPMPHSTDQPPISRPGRRLERGFWLNWWPLLLSVAAEFTIIFWASDFFGREGLSGRSPAAGVLVIFFAAMFIGRALGSRAASRISSAWIIVVSLAIAFCGSLSYCWAVSILPRVIGLALLGLGIANLYPTFLSRAIAKAKRNQVEASAKTTLASGLAILVFPFVLGAVADLTTLRQAQLLVPSLLVATFCIFLCSRHLEKAS